MVPRCDGLNIDYRSISPSMGSENYISLKQNVNTYKALGEEKTWLLSFPAKERATCLTWIAESGGAKGLCTAGL